MTRAKDGDGAAAHPDGVSLLDKTTFYRWAQDTHRLDGGEQYVLSVIVFDLLGLEDGKPHNAWTTLGVLSTSCHLRRRAVQRVLDRLKELGLVVHHGVAGRGGRTLLHVPGVVDAANLLKRRQLRDGTKDQPEPNGHDTSDDAPSKRCRPRRLNAVEKASSETAKRCRPRRLNPLNESFEESESVEGARGAAASSPRAPSVFDEGREEGAFGQDDADALTRPRRRLRQRLVGMANKLGLQADGSGLLHASDEDTVKRWLRRQREKRETLLTQDLLQAFVDHYGLNPIEAGRKLATRAEPQPAPEPKPRRQEPPPPPARPPSPSPPPPAFNGGGARIGLRMVSDAIHEPVREPPPWKPLVFTDEQKRASAERLKRYLP